MKVEFQVSGERMDSLTNGAEIFPGQKEKKNAQ